jgi:hypothetical protein
VDDLSSPFVDGPTPYAAPATRAWVERVAIEERLHGTGVCPPRREAAGRETTEATGSG